MRRIIKAPIGFDTPEEEKSFIRECEADFERRLSETAAEICGVEDAKVITLSGPTCSGKTTAANKIISEFGKRGKRVHVISIDDFYYDKEILHKKSEQNRNGEIDYDSAETIDLESFSDFVNRIFESRELLCPVFDFKSGIRTSYRSIKCEENDIFIFEGIQAIYPEVRAILDIHGYISVYISPRSSIEAGGELFEPNEIRLLRRTVRDCHFRDTSAEFTLKIWKSVRDNEERNIFPYEDSCLFYIDSTFAYELGILKPYLEEYLASVGQNSPQREEADRILEKIKAIGVISEEYLSPNSLYKEFV
ncbi:MAG: hypothetical protein IJV72_06415 [Clostridia bacterium]|nr:hypothetical protein [Clostridia bacterium]